MVLDKNYPQDALDAVDLRSDTVTRPTELMFEAMKSAPLGDDVLGDDPTVMRLEELAAELLGKEAALFVPSGTMANQVAIATHTRPGDAILVEEYSHVVSNEGGASGAISGVVTWTIPSELGVMDPEEIEKRVRRRNIHSPGTTLICIENTHNWSGGTVVPLESMAEYRAVAIHHGLRIHLDGARIFNAALALHCDPMEIAAHVDSVMFCLSKGLRSPVGSVLCGARDFIEEARFWRKRLGGGMRQAGLLAACGIVSLTKYVDRLDQDHGRARELAMQLRQVRGFKVDMASVQTNMVMVDCDQPAAEVQKRLKAQKVWVLPVSSHRLRLVLHADIDDNKLDHAVEAFCLAGA